MNGQGALLYILLLGAPALAGCLEASPATAPPDGPPSLEAEGRAAQLAEIERLWGGATARVIFDADLATLGPSATNGFYWMGRAEWTPRDQLVLAGTERLEVLATWVDPTLTGFALTYSPAHSPREIPAGDLRNGEPLTIPVSPGMTDLPHQDVSRWLFRVFGNTTPSHGAFHVTITLHRVASLADWPPLPRFFADGPWLTLLNETVDPAPFFWVQNDSNFKDVPPTHIVPPGARTLLVNITLTEFTQAGEPQPVDEVILRYRSAKTLRYTNAEHVAGPDAAGTWRYLIPIEDDASADSPYAATSEWRFEVRPSSVDRANGTPLPCKGCLPTDWAYHIEASATPLQADDARAAAGLA